jgi:capsular exopolysaccharide synthesis family protein
MKQEIQLTAKAPMVDYWTQGQSAVGAAPAAGGHAAQSPLKKIHRLLRGRYPLALFLVLAGGLAGAMAGFVLLEPKFQSEGLIQVNPEVITGNVTDLTTPMIGMKMASITDVITSTGVAEYALADPNFIAAWKKAYPGVDIMAPVDFAAALEAEHVKNSFNIMVTFIDKNKDVAQAGTRAAIKAYLDHYGDSGGAQLRESLAYDRTQLANELKDLDAKRAQLASLGEELGTTDLTTLEGVNGAELARREGILEGATTTYEQAKNAQIAPPTKAPDREFLIGQIAGIDAVMRAKVAVRDRDQDILDGMKLAGYLPSYPKYQQAMLQAAEANDEVDKYLQDFQIRNGQRAIPGLVDNSPVDIALAKTNLDQAQDSYDRQFKKVQHIEKVKTAIGTVNTSIQDIQTQITEENHNIDTLTAATTLTKNIQVVEIGADAQPASNKRPIAAIVGFALGGAIPLGLLMLYGMVDHRFRYSDDATHADLGGVALLGILPNLPDRLSDPQQAGIAAHCVHQIRTMLQISRNNDEPQILAVTSAAPADGKTSLTLALGLSYAACGARTLLIDCDLIGAGLSHRLNVHAPEGMLEAVANRALLEYVLTTDIADVALLPVGTAHAHHASTLSPVALRRLLSEAKKHFDIVLVDTGPILGSIEASLVCAAADRTILTVARGQQRPLVERSIGHLQAIGARLAGVVFNRAQPRDFEKSLSGLALRSRPLNGNAASVSGPSVTGPVVPPPATSGAGKSFKRAV